MVEKGNRNVSQEICWVCLIARWYLNSAKAVILLGKVSDCVSENMGCICSKGASEIDGVDECEKEKELNKASVHLVAPASSKRESLVAEIGSSVGRIDGSVRGGGKSRLQTHGGSVHKKSNDEDSRTIIVERPTNSHHQRGATMDLGTSGRRPEMCRTISIPNGAEGAHIIAGWPSWLTSVAADAVKGWVPRRADSFEKLDKVSSVFGLFTCLLLW